MWNNYWSVASLKEALDILEKEREKARIIAGGSDLVLEIKNKVRSNIETLIDISRIDFGEEVWQDDKGRIHISPSATHNHIINSKLINKFAPILSQASYSIGTPQIRNIGTIFGNLITASPANDTITALIALDSTLKIQSTKSSRNVKLNNFYKGVRKIDLEPNELVSDLFFEPLKDIQKSIFLKYILRKIHAISVVNIGIILNFNKDEITNAVVTLGAVAPTIIHATTCEDYLTGKILSTVNIDQAAKLAELDATPISDIRSSDIYRNRLVEELTKRALELIRIGEEKKVNPESPVYLWGNNIYKPSLIKKTFHHDSNTPIKSTINGENVSINTLQNKTLLKFVREGAELTGTKYGCGEGECGACTLILDGIPVLSCLIPAPRAHEAEIKTIEGLDNNGKLHPIQQAYVEEAAVQCGYCTPGFIMSTYKLLEEIPNPSEDQIAHGLAGNICRCTGYYSIIKAVEKAAKTLNSQSKEPIK